MIITEDLTPRLKALVENLDPDDREDLETLLAVCVLLSRTNPLYAKVPVFSLGDVFAATGEWETKIRHLCDTNLLTLHQTIPSAAKALGVKTIQDGSGVASAISFPRSLWLAASKL